jgi:hypothetical protein
MKFSFFTLKYSVFFLKTNFIFMIFLQGIKLFLNKQNINSGLNSSKGAPDQSNHFIESTSNYFYAFLVNFKKFFLSFVSTFTYDVKQFEATKTEIINFVKIDKPQVILDNKQDANFNPIIISESYVNFSELLQFSNIKHIIKLTYLFNLNLNCILVNLAIVSYFLVKQKKYKLQNVGNFLSKRFLKLNLLFVNVLFIVLILTDSLYMLLLNTSFKNQPTTIDKQNLKDSNVLLDFLFNYVKTFDKNQQSSYWNRPEEVPAQNKDVISVESSFSSLQSINLDLSSENNFFTIATLKINIIIMVISICMLSLYSYMTKLDMDSTVDNQSCKYIFRVLSKKSEFYCGFDFSNRTNSFVFEA